MGVALPPGCVTGVGSLPFVDPQLAVRFVAEHCPVLPFWPQLPGRHPSEGVIPQGLGRLSAFLEPAAKPFCWQVRADCVSSFASALKEDDAAMIPDSAAGFFEFENAIRAGSFPGAAAFKAQSEGPATVAHCVFVDGKPLARQPGWLGLVTTFVARQAVWQVVRLQRLGKPVLFVLDEPSAISVALITVHPADRARPEDRRRGRQRAARRPASWGLRGPPLLRAVAHGIDAGPGSRLRVVRCASPARGRKLARSCRLGARPLRKPGVRTGADRPRADARQRSCSRSGSDSPPPPET